MIPIQGARNTGSAYKHNEEGAPAQPMHSKCFLTDWWVMPLKHQFSLRTQQVQSQNA